MTLSEEDYLFKLTERFADWAQIFSNLSFRYAPERDVLGYYNQDEIFGFKMVASFSLELYMKANFYCLIHKNYPEKKLTNFNDVKKFLKQKKYDLFTHNLTDIKKYIIKEDASFKDVNLEKAIGFFNCFEEIRYPTPSNKPNQIIGLFDYNDEMMRTFLKTYEFLRGKSKEYIRHINQNRTDELERESEEAKEWSEYLYYK